MCGICCILGPADSFDLKEKKQLVSSSRIRNRGPDACKWESITLSHHTKAAFCGYILHLRGQLTPQPVIDKHGNLFLWNGEVFDGLSTLQENDNDTQVLLEQLALCKDDKQVISLFSYLQGPWAFIYWQATSQKLWFGRDVFGRRSLLWHLPKSTDDTFILSSVQIGELDFEELPSLGIFCLESDSQTPEHWSGQLTLYPWLNPVWPPTGEYEEDLELKIQQTLSHCSCLSFSLSSFTPHTFLPSICKELPPQDYSLPQTDTVDANYLRSVWESNPRLRQEAEKLIDILGESVCKRVLNQNKCYLLNKNTFCARQNSSSLAYSCKLNQDSSEASILNLPKSEDDTEYTEAPKLNQDSSEASILNLPKSEDDTEYTEASKLNQDSSEASISNLPKSEDDTKYTRTSKETLSVNQTSQSERLDKSNPDCSQETIHGNASVGILFSGGLDATVIAALADRFVPLEEPIDLLNVAFGANTKSLNKNTKQSKSAYQQREEKKTALFSVPDRLTGYCALQELNPNRKWNFIEVNITVEELHESRINKVANLLYPLCTVLDDSIGCAVWFAARGQGILGNGPQKGHPYCSHAKVVLCGMGADELFAGYSRHRASFSKGGWKGLIDEMQIEINRISSRNLGRDDRIISDHGREARFPYLDEKVTNFIAELPVYIKTNLTLARGLGEKLLLRLCALHLGLPATAIQPKRAIQFGSRIAKLENSKEKANDVCKRLYIK